MTKNEKITIIISSIALAISLLQFFVSLPMISSKIYSTEIIGKKILKEIRDDIVQNNFMVKNNGNKAAEKLEIKLVCRLQDSVEILTNSLYEVNYNKIESAKQVVIKVDHFVPNERIFILVFSDESKNKLNFFTKPRLINIKCSEGLGEIELEEDDKIVFKSKLEPKEAIDSMFNSLENR